VRSVIFKAWHVFGATHDFTIVFRIGKVFHYVRQLHSSMSPFEVVQAIQSAGVGVVGLDLRRTVVVLRSVDNQDVSDDTFPVRFPANRKILRVP